MLNCGPEPDYLDNPLPFPLLFIIHHFLIPEYNPPITQRRAIMLHIHNGDSTANIMREADFPGEHLAFREALALGPTPQTTLGEWLDVRANYLAAGSGLETDKVRADLVRLDAALNTVADYDEATLWFEHDLLCQINLSYLLARFAHQGTNGARLSLICIGEYPGIENFRGLGELTAAQMTGLFDTRHEVTDAEKRLAETAWSAYCSPDPRAVEQLIAEDTSALPYLKNALLQHLARFPSVPNGLSHAENKLLKFIADGETEFTRLCRKFFDAEPAYGLGDYAVWQDLQHLAYAARPLIVISGFDEDDGASFASRIYRTRLAITDAGNAVLNDASDFIEMNGIDHWLGGVHLRAENFWRWDEAKQELHPYGACF